MAPQGTCHAAVVNFAVVKLPCDTWVLSYCGVLVVLAMMPRADVRVSRPVRASIQWGRTVLVLAVDARQCVTLGPPGRSSGTLRRAVRASRRVSRMEVSFVA